MWNTLPEQSVIEKTKNSLIAHGIDVVVVETAADAKKEVLSRIPKDADVMTMSSETLAQSGIDIAINTSADYVALKPKLYAMDRATQGREMQQMGSAPEVAVGSVHAVTTDGHVIIASNTGSQLPAYAYGSDKVIWVVGAQKIVATIEDGMRRLTEYTLPLENERVKKAYGMPGSFISKLLIVNREVIPGRVTMIIVKEVLGF